MAHGRSVSIDQATGQTASAAVLLLAAGGEIRAVFAGQPHAAELAVPVPGEQARTTLLAAIPFASHAGQLNVVPSLEER